MIVPRKWQSSILILNFLQLHDEDELSAVDVAFAYIQHAVEQCLLFGALVVEDEAAEGSSVGDALPPPGAGSRRRG